MGRLIDADAYLEHVKWEADGLSYPDGETFVTITEWLLDKTPAVSRIGYKPKANSTLAHLSKGELIDEIRLLEDTLIAQDWQLRNQAKVMEELIKLP